MRKIVAWLLVGTIMLSFAACGKKRKLESVVPETGSQANHYPITVTDQAGRSVLIEQEPQRLISAYYITTSLLMALDLEDKLVGIENNPEKRAVYGLCAPELLNLPTVGTVKELDLEATAALEPDLVILPMKLKNTAALLEELDIDVLLVDPEDQERLVGMIELTALATETEDTAQKLLAFIQEQQTYLENSMEGTQRPTVYLAGNSSMLKTAGNAMYQANLIQMAGGINVANEIGDTYWAEIDYEQLLTWNPDYIILAAEATYDVEDVLSDPNLAECTAVKNGNVYQLPNHAEAWDSPVPGSVLGALWLANILHKDVISNTEYIARVDAYYETFYDFTYSEN